MKKVEPAIRIIATGTLFLLLLTGLLIGTFFLTAWLYHTIGHAPPPFLVQVINSLLGVALYAVIRSGFFSLINARQGGTRRPMWLFEPSLAAIEQIAKEYFQIILNRAFRAKCLSSQ